MRAIPQDLIHALARAAEQGKLTVEVNPEETVLSALVRWRLAGKAEDVLPSLATAFQESMGPEAGV